MPPFSVVDKPASTKVAITILCAFALVTQPRSITGAGERGSFVTQSHYWIYARSPARGNERSEDGHNQHNQRH